MGKTQLEKAIYLAAKAFVTSCDLDKQLSEEATPSDILLDNGFEAVPQRAPAQHVPRSNGIPFCERHGKAMKLGDYGYHCTSKDTDPRFSNARGYCNAKAPA